MTNQLDDANLDQDTAPNFFIIGAARSGTTTLTEMLRQHPSIFITQPKEPHYLALAGQEVRFRGPGDDQMINSIAITSLDPYLSLYQSAGGKIARGDASVSTLYYARNSVETLRHDFPAARLIAVLREPISRAFSAYSYLRVRGFEPCESFLDAVQQEDQRVQRNWHHFWHYIGMGRYAAQLRVFLEGLGPHQLKILFYEDLIGDPAAAAREVFAHLHVEDTIEVEAKHVNPSGTPRNHLTQKTMQMLTRQRYMRKVLKNALPFGVRERIRVANLQPAAVSEEAKRALETTFRPEVADLHSLLSDYYPDLIEKAPSWLRSNSQPDEARV